jgi:hypothetical protein
MLAQLRDRLDDPVFSQDFAAKRQIIDLLAPRILVRTEGHGRRRQAEITVTYSFSPPRTSSVTVSSTAPAI